MIVKKRKMMMTAKELIDKLDPNAKENLEYRLVEYFFRLTLRIYTVDYKEEK